MRFQRSRISIAMAGLLLRFGVSLASLPAVAILPLSSSVAWAAGQEKALYSFSGSDGQAPDGSLVFDAADNLYGTTSAGGFNGSGTVFKLSRGSNGAWIETTLHEFNLTDGANPEGSLIFDNSGNLYGTTSSGGAYANGTGVRAFTRRRR